MQDVTYGEVVTCQVAQQRTRPLANPEGRRFQHSVYEVQRSRFNDGLSTITPSRELGECIHCTLNDGVSLCTGSIINGTHIGHR